MATRHGGDRPLLGSAFLVTYSAVAPLVNGDGGTCRAIPISGTFIVIRSALGVVFPNELLTAR